MCSTMQAAPALAEGSGEIPTAEIKKTDSQSRTVLSSIASKAAMPILGMLTTYGSITPTAIIGSKVPPTALDVLTHPLLHLPATLSQAVLGVSYQLTDVLTGTTGSIASKCSFAGWRQEVVSGPLAEELVFRWGLQDKMLKPTIDWAIAKVCPDLSPELRKTAAAVTAIVMASALFASAHHVAGSTAISNEWTQRFLRGIIYGALEEIDGITSATAAHMLHNHVKLGRICAS